MSDGGLKEDRGLAAAPLKRPPRLSGSQRHEPVRICGEGDTNNKPLSQSGTRLGCPGHEPVRICGEVDTQQAIAKRRWKEALMQDGRGAMYVKWQ